LPAAAGTIDAVVLPLSAHELRTAAARRALFGEIRRVLAPGGRVVVVEHLRNLANVAAFGPGALHFHSRRTWAQCFSEAAFVVCREFPITPFVRVFVLRAWPDRLSDVAAVSPRRSVASSRERLEGRRLE
jgi:SAM-dependent methyltransferase